MSIAITLVVGTVAIELLPDVSPIEVVVPSGFHSSNKEDTLRMYQYILTEHEMIPVTFCNFMISGLENPAIFPREVPILTYSDLKSQIHLMETKTVVLITFT
jgi:hypothetical protein